LSAKYAVLGMLREGPAYSYELAARIPGLLGPRYQIHSGQMTQIVRSLHDDELIEPIDMPTTRGDDRSKVYAITERGHADWEEFFHAGPNVAQLARRSLLVKIALAGPQRLGEVLAQLDVYEQDCIDRINEVREALEKLLPDDQLRPRAENVFVQLGVDADVYQLRAELAWTRHARQMVSWLLGSDAIWPSAGRRQAAPSDASQARRDEARQSILSRLAQRDQHQ
jgi:DNA-binding PadR family transcriptional regulator